MRKWLTALLASASLALGGMAHAASYDFGSLTGTTTSPLMSVGASSSAIDNFFFQLTGPANVGAGASNVLVSANPVFTFATFTASLYDQTSNAFVTSFTLASSATTQNLSYAGLLGAGSYRIDVTRAAGGAGGAYLVSLSNNGAPVVPVPEPESYVMFFAGLGLIGAIVRRRVRG